jgi:hypothetical protein
MSIQKVNHNVWQAFNSQSVVKSSGSATSEWWDVNGWTDKAVTYEADVTDGSGSLSLTYTMDVSPKGYYELNNAASVTTDDYSTVTIASGATSAVMVRVDSADVDDLQRPMRSVRFKVVNADASDNATVNLWLEGWS